MYNKKQEEAQFWIFGFLVFLLHTAVGLLRLRLLSWVIKQAQTLLKRALSDAAVSGSPFAEVQGIIDCGGLSIAHSSLLTDHVHSQSITA